MKQEAVVGIPQNKVGVGEEYRSLISSETEQKFIAFQKRVQETIGGVSNPIAAAIYHSTVQQITGEAVSLLLVKPSELKVLFSLIEDAVTLSVEVAQEVKINRAAQASQAAGQTAQA